MIEAGNGYFANLYQQCRCPRCRSYLVYIETKIDGKDWWQCKTCKMVHIGVGVGNDGKFEAGTIDNRCNSEVLEM